MTTVVPGNVRTPRQMKWYSQEAEAEIVEAQCLKQRVEPRACRLACALPGVGRCQPVHRPRILDRRRLAMSPRPECVCALGAELGEGPVWSAREQALWFVDIKQGHIHRLCCRHGQTRELGCAGPAGIYRACRRAARFIVGTKSGLYSFDPADGGFVLRHAVEPDKTRQPAERRLRRCAGPSLVRFDGRQ